MTVTVGDNEKAIQELRALIMQNVGRMDRIEDKIDRLGKILIEQGIIKFL